MLNLISKQTIDDATNALYRVIDYWHGKKMEQAKELEDMGRRLIVYYHTSKMNYKYIGGKGKNE